MAQRVQLVCSLLVAVVIAVVVILLVSARVPVSDDDSGRGRGRGRGGDDDESFVLPPRDQGAPLMTAGTRVVTLRVCSAAACRSSSSSPA